MALTDRQSEALDAYCKRLAEALAGVWPEIPADQRERLAVLLTPEPADTAGDTDGRALAGPATATDYPPRKTGS